MIVLKFPDSCSAGKTTRSGVKDCFPFSCSLNPPIILSHLNFIQVSLARLLTGTRLTVKQAAGEFTITEEIQPIISRAMRLLGCLVVSTVAEDSLTYSSAHAGVDDGLGEPFLFHA